MTGPLGFQNSLPSSDTITHLILFWEPRMADFTPRAACQARKVLDLSTIVILHSDFSRRGLVWVWWESSCIASDAFASASWADVRWASIMGSFVFCLLLTIWVSIKALAAALICWTLLLYTRTVWFEWFMASSRSHCNTAGSSTHQGEIGSVAAIFLYVWAKLWRRLKHSSWRKVKRQKRHKHSKSTIKSKSSVNIS